MQLTSEQVLTAIRANHLKANIGAYERGLHGAELHWDRAWVDSMGPGSIYATVPVTLWFTPQEQEHYKTLVGLEPPPCDEIVVRVYPPARLARQLAARWQRE